MLFRFPGRRGEFPRLRVEEAKSLDLQPPVAPNGHFVSSRREKTPRVLHGSQNAVGKTYADFAKTILDTWNVHDLGETFLVA